MEAVVDIAGSLTAKLPAIFPHPAERQRRLPAGATPARRTARLSRCQGEQIRRRSLLA
jgi:hypothetical protein